MEIQVGLVIFPSGAFDIDSALEPFIRAARSESVLCLPLSCSRANLHPTYVGGIERGERNLSLENLHRIASAFSLSLAELFDFPTPKKSDRNLLELRILTLIRNQDAKVLDLIWNVVDQVDQWTKKVLPPAID